MNETTFTLFQNTVEGIEIIIYACILAAFFRSFMTGKKEWNPQKSIRTLIVFLSYAAVYFINIAADLDGWVCMVIVTALLAAASRYLGIDRKPAFLLGYCFSA